MKTRVKSVNIESCFWKSGFLMGLWSKFV